MSRFNFTLAIKPRKGGYFHRHPEPRSDTVRLTTKNLWIGSDLVRTLRKRNNRCIIRIEKDPKTQALRITPGSVSDPMEETYRLHVGEGHTDIHTTRPAPLFDMSNGNYKQHSKYTNVFVLDV